MEIKYVYFEVHSVIGVDPIEEFITNENILLFKPPHTNELGSWSCKHATERKEMSIPTYFLVEQNWIDFEKFKEYNIRNNTDISKLYLSTRITEVMEKLKPLIRNGKINTIIDKDNTLK